MERQPRRRRRPALSCLECRRRKIKCDRNEPCTNCVTAKTQCTFEVLNNEAGPAIRQQTQPGHSRDSMPSPSPPSINHNDIPINIGSNDARLPDRTQTEASDLCDLLLRVQKLEKSSIFNPMHANSVTGLNLLTGQTGLHDSEVILNKTRMLGWSHRMGWGGEFSLIWDCYTEASGNDSGTAFESPEIRSMLLQIGDLLKKCKIIARSIKVGRPSRCLSCPGFILSPPSRELADAMVNLYFKSFESTHRILHVSTFWTEYQRYWTNPDSVTTGLRLKIFLVIAIGSSLYEQADNELGFRDTVHQWIYAAQTWLSGPLEKDRLDITGLQVHCLTILGRQIFSIGGDLVWMSMGSLVHRAMQIGLHRDPKHLPAMNLLQAEVRRRLWATILEMVVQSSLDSAMPPRISYDEFDTEVPSNINDDEIDDLTTLLRPRPKTTYTSTSMQLLLLESLPIRLRILRLLNGLHSELSYTDALALSAEITKALRDCNKFMKENEDSGVTPFHRNLLYCLVRRFLIPLHCPFANKARSNPLFHYSLKVSLDAAMAIISPEPDQGFARLMSIGGGLFREGIRYAMSVISVELLAQTEVQRLDGTLHSNSQNGQLLKQAVKEMISLSAERIRQGETNIKSHMFLSMVIAQVEAMETGASCEYAVAKSARDSLEFCHDLLQARAGILSFSDKAFTTPSPYGGEDYGLDLDLDFFLPDASFS